MIKTQVIKELGDNYNVEDDDCLNSIIDRIETIAKHFSNSNTTDLNPYIIKCVKAEYLCRGGEGLNGLNESGKSSNFLDNVEIMKNEIIKAGLRRCY